MNLCFDLIRLRFFCTYIYWEKRIHHHHHYHRKYSLLYFQVTLCNAMNSHLAIAWNIRRWFGKFKLSVRNTTQFDGKCTAMCLTFQTKFKSNSGIVSQIRANWVVFLLVFVTVFADFGTKKPFTNTIYTQCSKWHWQ